MAQGRHENCYDGITWTTTEDEVELETAGSPPWAGSSITFVHCSGGVDHFERYKLGGSNYLASRAPSCTQPGHHVCALHPALTDHLPEAALVRSWSGDFGRQPLLRRSFPAGPGGI